MRDNQTRLETEMGEWRVEWVPARTKLTVHADRGFGKSERYECCALLGIDTAIRPQQGILVTVVEGNRAAAVECLLANSTTARTLHGAFENLMGQHEDFGTILAALWMECLGVITPDRHQGYRSHPGEIAATAAAVGGGQSDTSGARH